MPHTFLSVITDDCIAKGKDYNAGGARYNNTFIQAVGIGSITDSLSALKDLVFDRAEFALPRFVEVLDADFNGHEPLRQRVLNKTHKYGNDDDYADALMTRTFRMLFEAIDGRPNTKGGAYRLEMLPTTCHVYFGEVCLASADGRGEGQPVSEGISPVQGADRHGPTAVLKSASKMDHVKTGGTLLNMKFTPSLLEGDGGIDNLHAPGALVLQARRPSHAVQRGHRRTSCARPRPTRRRTATSSSAWPATATTSATCPSPCRTRSSGGRSTRRSRRQGLPAGYFFQIAPTPSSHSRLFSAGMSSPVSWSARAFSAAHSAFSWSSRSRMGWLTPRQVAFRLVDQEQVVGREPVREVLHIVVGPGPALDHVAVPRLELLEQRPRRRA